jgi:hypothetical protein
VLSGADEARTVPRAGYVVIGVLSAAASLLAFLHFFRHDQVLLYGDAVAHINIARRVFDSRTPGPLQLGTVWLPLPHILMLPFVVSDWMWRSGVGGAIVSMLAYVAGVLGIFRLVGNGLGRMQAGGGIARASAWLAAIIYGANPNLLYLQATAMTEPLSLALFVWATVFFSDFADQQRRGEGAGAGRSLQLCGWTLAAAMLTRYDAWFAGAVFAGAALLVYLVPQSARHPDPEPCEREGPAFLRHRGVRSFLLIVALAPALWLGYNALVWGNPLEFATGPYSARAIAQRTHRPQAAHHPGWHSPYVAALHFLKAAKLNMGEGYTTTWEKPWLPAALLGSLAILLLTRGLASWLLLWAPLPFYALAIAWGSVPIFVPPWWPYSYYNARYGIELLPAIAALTAAAFYFGWTAWRWRTWRVFLSLAAVLLVAGSYASVWRNTPICLREALVNSRSKRALEKKLAARLEQLPRSATLLMYTGEHAGALQRAGIPLRRTINEGNRPLWKKSLADPAGYADFAIATAGDPVAAAVAAHGRMELNAKVSVPGQPEVSIFRAVRER